MYSVSKEMPLESYQIIQPAQNQTNFVPGQVIRFTIPRSSGFWDSHLSYAQFNVKTTGANYKMCFNSVYGGIASMFDMVRLTQNGTVISEGTNYNQLQHSIKCYELSLSGLQRKALEKGLVDFPVNSNCGAKTLSNQCLVGQGVHRSGEVSADNMQQDVKFKFSLDFVSLFEMLEVVPNIALGDLILELRISQDVPRILKVLPSTNSIHTCSAVPTAGTAFIVNLTPGFVGFTNLADSPFIVGQKVVAVNETNVIGITEYTITGLSQADGTGVITITTETNVSVVDAGKTKLYITSGSDGNEAVASTNFIVSKSELQLQIVKPNSQYVQSIMEEVVDGQMFIDVDTWSSYPLTVFPSIKTQTLTIDTTQSRVKSFLIAPRLGSQTGVLSKFNDTDWSYDGVFGNLRNYRCQIDGEYYPDVPIELSAMIGGWHFSAEHMRELEKAFDASNLPLRSMLGLKQNFLIGRTLSVQGSSTNLTGTPINVYLDYNGNGPTTSTIPNSTVGSISTAGTNYIATPAPMVLNTSRVSGSFGKGMKVRVSSVDSGAITAINIIQQGSGYENGDILQINGDGVALGDGDITAGTGYSTGLGLATRGGTGSGCTVDITSVDGGGGITGLTIDSVGTGYTTGDSLTVVQGAETSGSFLITLVARDGRITLSKTAPSLDAIAFVNHTNRIAVSELGLEVIN